MRQANTIDDAKAFTEAFNPVGRSVRTGTVAFTMGEIPEGYDVHHSNFDKENNNISNLVLLTKEEHKKIHLSHKTKKSPEKKTKFICKVCGCEYESVNRGNNNYCSQKCKKLAERKRDMKIKTCEICGREFSTSDDAKFCSKKMLRGIS